MDTITRLIEYIELSDKTLREYEENNKTKDPFYKKLEKYSDRKNTI